MKRIAWTLLGMLAFWILCLWLRDANAATTYQPLSLGVVNLSFDSMTLTAIQASTPPTVGYPVWCGNCASAGGNGTVCYSTGSTNSFQWVLSTGTACK